MSERDDVLDRVAQMWRHRDPVPPELVDTVLVALATESIDEEYELLHFIERSQQLEGVRGVDSPRTLTVSFSAGRFSLLLRISGDVPSDGTRRVDGWVSPAEPMRVRVTQGAAAHEVDVDERGRFEVPQVSAGLTRFWLLTDPVEGEPERPFATPTFEL